MAEAFHRGISAMKLEELWPDRRASARPGKRSACDVNVEEVGSESKAAKPGDAAASSSHDVEDCNAPKRSSTRAELEVDMGGQRDAKSHRIDADDHCEDLEFINEDEDPWGEGPNFDL